MLENLEEKFEGLEEKQEKQYTKPEEIAPFWRSPIPHPLEDLAFDIFYIEEKRGQRIQKRVNLPADEKTGKVIPPFSEDEILSFGYGAGKYLFKPKSIKTGKYLPGSETHYLGEEETVEENKIVKEESSELKYIAEMIKQQIEMFKLQTEITRQQNERYFAMMIEIIKAISNYKQQDIGYNPTDIAKSMSDAYKEFISNFMEMMKEAEIKKVEILGKQIDADTQLKLKQMELAVQQGKDIFADEELRKKLEELEEKLKEAKSGKPGWQEALKEFINLGTEFLTSLNLLFSRINALQQGVVPAFKSPQEISNPDTDKEIIKFLLEAMHEKEEHKKEESEVQSLNEIKKEEENVGEKSDNQEIKPE